MAFLYSAMYSIEPQPNQDPSLCSIYPTYPPPHPRSCLHPHPNDRPLQLPHAPTAAQTPLLPHEPLVDPLPHDAAEGPILHQAPRLLLAQPAHAHDLDPAPLEHAEDALVVPRERVLLHGGGAAFELAEGEAEGGDGGAVGCGGGGEDEAGVGQRGGAGEGVEEPFDQGELVRVDGLVRAGDVVGVPHRVRQAVHAQQQGRATGAREFAVEQFEDGPGDRGVFGAEEGEAGEGDVRGHGDGEVVLGWGLGELEGGEDGVGAGDGAEEGGGVGALEVEGRVGGGEGTVFGVAEDEVLGLWDWSAGGMKGASSAMFEGRDSAYLLVCL